jgi:two-component system, chemotaxis family, CheB/CheR fusion protein
VTAPTDARGHRMPINHLFVSLASDQGNRAIGIVLSGTGSDGTEGLRSIKEKGGLTIVQAPIYSEFEGMPASALATGLVDYQLRPSEMPSQLSEYIKNSFEKLAASNVKSSENQKKSLEKIFTVLKTSTGHDFSRYKPNTILRRIERRMAVHHLTSFDAYLSKLIDVPDEVSTLFGELLIGVTCFFRDSDAFESFESLVISKVIEDDPKDVVIRVWVAGCSTGEEAYSIAILMQERVEQIKKNVRLLIFATDIDPRAIATARAGVYPASIANDVSPTRLGNYFTLQDDGANYRIRKIIRDSIVFSEHDLIRDPPFSKLDMVTCRNVLIYFEPDLQRKVIAFFHYALKPKGMLFLGTSESVGEFGDLFTVLDRKAKIYQQKEDVQAGKRAALARIAPSGLAVDQLSEKHTGIKGPTKKISLRELTEQSLISLVAPVAVLVNSQGDILYLHGHAGLFLDPATGDAGINNVLTMAREGLRRVLTSVLYRVVLTKEPIRLVSFSVAERKGFKTGHLSVCSVAKSAVSNDSVPDLSAKVGADAASLYLIVLEEAIAPVALAGAAASSHKNSSVKIGGQQLDVNQRIQELSDQLRSKEDFLQSVNHELENSNEELKSSNEEMQSVNEELQSTNEELETSKEEMQSVNEELTTVNTELQLKVNDSYRANSDMNNLLAGTGIGTVFLDHQLNILRFTPAATKIIHLIGTDVGRPVAHLVSNLIGYSTLVQDVQSVLDTLVPKEIDVQTVDKRFYTMRILPYRTLDNVVEGAVITFVDVTEVVEIRVALRKANDLLRLAVVVRDSFDAITVQDLEGRIIAWNPAAVRIYGWSEEEALTLNVKDRLPSPLKDLNLKNEDPNSLEPVTTQRLSKDGRVVSVSLTSTPLFDSDGALFATATTERETK